MKNQITTTIVAIVIAILATIVFNKVNATNAKLAYVDSSKLMIGFSEANKIQKEIEQMRKEYETNKKMLEDSLNAQMELMTQKFDSAPKKEKDEMRKKLQEWNTKLQKYTKAGNEKIAKEHQEKMGKVLEKVNAFITEYGDEHGYDLIFGTTSGNILYASKGKIDLTNEIIKGLNERYK